MKKRKIRKSEWILIAVLVFVIGFVMSLDSKIQKTKRANRSLKSGAREGRPAAGTPVAGGGRDRPVQMADVIDRWGQDPFDRPFTRETDLAGGAGISSGGQPDLCKLFGIIISSGGAMALIGDRFCTVGDTVQHYTVESITRDQVVIRNVLDGSKRILRVE
jgi:hypothetical protein